MSTEPKIDWTKPLQTVRGIEVSGDMDEEAICAGFSFANGKHACFTYYADRNGKLWDDGLPHGDCPYDLVNVPEPEPAPDPVEALRAEVAELRERLAKIEAEKQAEDVAVPGGVDWSKPLETVEGVPAKLLTKYDIEEYLYTVLVNNTAHTYTQQGTEFIHGKSPFDLRNVVST